MLHSSYYLQQLRDILSSYYFQQLRDILYIAPVVLIAIMGHEFAHGWVSNRLGDPTPRMDGRLTLNPLKHLDPFGTLCLIFFKMGWAKPVRINTRYYKNRKSGIIMVSLAGPFTYWPSFPCSFSAFSENTAVLPPHPFLYFSGCSIIRQL